MVSLKLHFHNSNFFSEKIWVNTTEDVTKIYHLWKEDIEGKLNETKHDGRKEMFYLTTHSTHFIYGYSFRLAERVLLYASSHGQDNTYQGLCYTSRGALAGTKNSPVGLP